jgi:endonuclease YncB( thermonuclease family)
VTPAWSALVPDLAANTRSFFAVAVLALAAAASPGVADAAVKAGSKRGNTATSPSAEATRAAAAAAAAAAALGAAHGAPSAPAIEAEFDDAPFQAGEVRGRVVRVVDGDTIWLVREGQTKPMKLRIEGIDAPEICQTFGPEAKRALANRILDRDVTAKLRAVDDWGRRIGHVYDGETDIGQRMVRDGMAWSVRYRWDRGPYVPDERMAQSFHRGLHAVGSAELPRDFRQRHGSCKTEGPQTPTSGGGSSKGGGGGR